MVGASKILVEKIPATALPSDRHPRASEQSVRLKALLVELRDSNP
jgi:hypothetical protein